MSSNLTAASVIHFYDTNTHGILCGVRGAEHRSTKHSRGVTCNACVGRLGDRATQDREGSSQNAPEQATT
jgi:hypothetical protein